MELFHCGTQVHYDALKVELDPLQCDECSQGHYWWKGFNTERLWSVAVTMPLLSAPFLLLTLSKKKCHKAPPGAEHLQNTPRLKE